MPAAERFGDQILHRIVEIIGAKRPLRLALAIIIGLIMSAAIGLHPVWFLLWLAIGPLYLLALKSGNLSESWLIGFLAGLGALFPEVSYYLTLMPPPVAVVIMLLQAAGWGLALLIAVLIVSRKLGVITVFALPCAWAGLETLIAATSPHGTAGSLAYSQMDALPIIQIASIGGGPAVVFTLLVPGSLMALIAARELTAAKRTAATRIVLAFLCLVLGYGAMRMRSIKDEQGQLVGLASIDHNLKWHSATPQTDEIINLYCLAVHTVSKHGAQLVVLPERIESGYRQKEILPTLQRLERVAMQDHVSIVVGVAEMEDGSSSAVNVLYLLGSDGAVVKKYTKRHLVPGFEDVFTPGGSPAAVALGGTKLGLSICKDMDFHSTGWDNAKLGASIVAVPAWDFTVDAWLHSRMAMLRGVENGFSVVRSARDGMLSVSDAAGRVYWETGLPAVMQMRAGVARVPNGPGRTVYSMIHDAFGWGCIAAVFGMLVLPVKRKQSSAVSEVNVGV